MRVALYFIVAYVLLGLQVGISRYVAFHGAAPNLGLLAVLFVALNARRNGALLGSFTIGLVQDLLSGQQLGIYALSYGLFAAGVVAGQRTVNKNHPFTHLTLALVGGLITTLILLTHSLFHPAASAIGEGRTLLRPLRISPGVEFMRMVYTAVLAPFVLVTLQRIRSIFVFQTGRRKAAWW